MKTYSNDPQDYTLEDACADEFDNKPWNDLLADIIVYFDSSEHALDSFKEWWVEQRIEEIKNEPKDYCY